MAGLRTIVCMAAFLVPGICVYAFLEGSQVFDGRFKSEPVAWYFLAKGLFCSLALYLSLRILEVLSRSNDADKSATGVNMTVLRIMVCTTALLVFGICVYAFLGWSNAFGGKFESNPLGWYFLAKGMFCSLSLYLSFRILEVLSRLKNIDKTDY